MGMFGNAFTRSLTPTQNVFARMQLISPNGGPGSTFDPVPNPLAQALNAYHPTPADTARNAVAGMLGRTGQLPGEAQRTAANVVAFSPVGQADDLNNGLLQTGRGVANQNAGETLGGVLAMALAGAPVKAKPLGVSEAADRLVARLNEALEGTGARVRSIHPTEFGTSAYVEGGSPIVKTADGRQLYSRVQVRVSDHPTGERRYLTEGGSHILVGPHGVQTVDDLDKAIDNEIAAYLEHYNGLLARR